MIATIIICAVILILIVAVVAYMIRDGRQGKGSCGCGCGCDGCRRSTKCNTKKK